jgi:hypothetical protein
MHLVMLFDAFAAMQKLVHRSCCVAPLAAAAQSGERGPLRYGSMRFDGLAHPGLTLQSPALSAPCEASTIVLPSVVLESAGESAVASLSAPGPPSTEAWLVLDPVHATTKTKPVASANETPR